MAVAAGTAALISGGSLYKIASLAGGGQTVAELLGGRLLHPQTTTLTNGGYSTSSRRWPSRQVRRSRRCICSKTRMGSMPLRRVILPMMPWSAVTRGCVRTLSRDELQGVDRARVQSHSQRRHAAEPPAHGRAFRHSLDRAYGLHPAAQHERIPGAADDRDDDRGGRNVLPLIGLALYVIGYVGVFFANLIKSAVSRQREFLADASAVQFTRNPDGIAGALKKIGALSAGLDHPRAAGRRGQPHVLRQRRRGRAALRVAGDASAAGRAHPPAGPSFDGDFSKVRLEPPGDEPGRAFDRRLGSREHGRLRSTRLKRLLRWAPLRRLNCFTRPGCWRTYRRRFPRSSRIHSVLRPLFSLCCSTLTEAVCRQQLAWLDQYAHPAVVRQMRAILPEVMKLAPEARLPLVELAVPALRQMSPAQMREFLERGEGTCRGRQQADDFRVCTAAAVAAASGRLFCETPVESAEIHVIRAAGRAYEGRALGAGSRGPIVARSGGGGLLRRV